MSQESINAAQFKDMLQAASDKLNENVELINSLNVFPVPDGDTGTNMSLSFKTGVEYAIKVKEDNIGAVSAGLSRGLLMGARGNSGVILSQLFRGFAKGVEGVEELEVSSFVQGLQHGIKTAYAAVMKPVEGTILSVAKASTQAAEEKEKETKDIIELVRAVQESANIALQKTPEQLPVLKEVGVVDSGGQGLAMIYDAFLEVLTGERVVTHATDIRQIDLRELAHEDIYFKTSHSINSEDIKYGYCTQMMLQLGKGKTATKDFDEEEFKKTLDSWGDSLIVIHDEDLVKVHVHVENPGDVLNYGQEFGNLLTIKIDNMREQHEDVLENRTGEKEEPKEKVPYAIIAVGSGEGVVNLLKESGATQIINGGQTMNPSTEDFVNEIKASNAENIILLPNNKNIQMAAEQAAEVVELPTAVIPTRSISQGLTALLGFSSDDDLETNEANMKQEMETVKSGQVTYAIRDTKVNQLDIKEDDYIGLLDGQIVISNQDRVQVTVDLIEKMLDEETELVTLIYGKDATEDEANLISERLLEKHGDDIEVEVHEGNQPVYPYLISVE